MKATLKKKNGSNGTKRKPLRVSARASKKKNGAEPMVSFVPARTLPLTVNGRTIEVHQGAKAEVPASYKALYDAAVGG